jgi:hypothetical protein
MFADLVEVPRELDATGQNVPYAGDGTYSCGCTVDEYEDSELLPEEVQEEKERLAALHPVKHRHYVPRLDLLSIFKSLFRRKR